MTQTLYAHTNKRKKKKIKIKGPEAGRCWRRTRG
jgi:hypothetical protein